MHTRHASPRRFLRIHQSPRRRRLPLRLTVTIPQCQRSNTLLLGLIPQRRSSAASSRARTTYHRIFRVRRNSFDTTIKDRPVEDLYWIGLFSNRGYAAKSRPRPLQFLRHRDLEPLVTTDYPIQQCRDNDGTQKRTCVVHVVSRDRQLCRERYPNNDEEQVPECD